METVMLNVIYWGGSAIQQLIMLKLFCCIIKPKYNIRITFVGTYVLHISQVVIKHTWLNNSIGIYVTFAVFMICMFHFLFQGKWYQKLLAFCVGNFPILIAEIVCMQIMFGFLGYEMENLTSGINKESVFTSTLAFFVYLIVSYIVLIVQKPLQYIMFAKNMMPIVFVFLASITGIFVYGGLMMDYELHNEEIFWLYLFFAVFVDLYMIQVMGELEVRQQSLEKLEFIQRKDENVQEYYHNLISRLRSASELKDEYNEKLKAIYEQFRLEYSQEISDEKIKNQESEELKSEPVWNAQAIVEQIVDSKKREMDKLGYSYDLDIKIPEEAAIELMDISGLLNNLLDNAVEAVHGYVENAKKNGIKCGQEKKEKHEGVGSREEIYIRGKSYIEEDMLVIEVENVKSPEQKVIEVGNKFVTSKIDKTGHGYGLQIIRRIAEKYDGRMDICYTKERFRNRVMLRNNIKSV